MHGALLVAILLAIFVACHAQTWLISNGVAFHLDHGSHCHNHLTPGFGLEARGWAIGAYSNSNCKWSIYAGKAWLPLRLGDFRLGAMAGGVSGYNAAITPVAALAASWEGSRYKANLL